MNDDLTPPTHGCYTTGLQATFAALVVCAVFWLCVCGSLSWVIIGLIKH